jgi:membrane protein implicated in regulation of membrane protease activity
MSQQHKSHQVDTMVGETAVLLDDVAPGQTGKAELRGTTWSARNAGTASLHKGQRTSVAKVDGLTLWLKSE